MEGHESLRAVALPQDQERGKRGLLLCILGAIGRQANPFSRYADPLPEVDYREHCLLVNVPLRIRSDLHL